MKILSIYSRDSVKKILLGISMLLHVVSDQGVFVYDLSYGKKETKTHEAKIMQTGGEIVVM